MARKQTLAELYATLPKIACKRLCYHSCGPVIPAACLPQELDRLVHLPIIQSHDAESNCGALLFNSCSVYANRPLICRLYGCVTAMTCPHGCEPEFWLTDEQVEQILRDHGGKKWVGRIHG